MESHASFLRGIIEEKSVFVNLKRWIRGQGDVKVSVSHMATLAVAMLYLPGSTFISPDRRPFCILVTIGNIV